MSNKAKAFIRLPLNFKGKLRIYPPTVQDVLGNEEFGLYSQILTVEEEGLRIDLRKANPNMEVFPNPFEFLLISCYNDKDIAAMVVRAFEFFCHTKVVFLYDQKKILIGDFSKDLTKINSMDDLKYLEEDEYFEFQNLIRASLGEKQIKPPQPFNPKEDPRIRRIKEKARERDLIKARKGTQGGISLDTCLTAICCMGIGITPLNIGEISYASVGVLMRMMQEKEKYHVDIRSILAGADAKKIKPKYWIRDFDKE